MIAPTEGLGKIVYLNWNWNIFKWIHLNFTRFSTFSTFFLMLYTSAHIFTWYFDFKKVVFQFNHYFWNPDDFLWGSISHQLINPPLILALCFQRTFPKTFMVEHMWLVVIYKEKWLRTPDQRIYWFEVLQSLFFFSPLW